MIQLTGVCAGYDGKDVLHEATLTLPNGQNLAVLGPNGCGKSTLLKAIAGILPHKGRIQIGSRTVGDTPRRELSKVVALMGQSVTPAFDFTVRDTVAQGRWPHRKKGFFGGAPTEEDEAIIAEAMRVTGTSSIGHRPVTALSGGQLQRVFLARTLAQQPKVILLDEPTNHLDLRYQAELVEYLCEWSRQPDHTVVGVFHDLNLAMGLAGHALLLKEGVQAAYGPTESTITSALLKEVYDMDVAAYMKASLKHWEDIR